MSIKMISAKLAATAAGVALLQGGAVRMAEPMNTDAPRFASDAKGQLVDTKGTPIAEPIGEPRYVKTQAVGEPRYVKTERDRIIQEPDRRRRIVERTIECEPVPGSFGGPLGERTVVAGATSLPEGAVEAYFDDVECPPVAQLAYAPAPLPQTEETPASPANKGSHDKSCPCAYGIYRHQ